MLPLLCWLVLLYWLLFGEFGDDKGVFRTVYFYLLLANPVVLLIKNKNWWYQIKLIDDFIFIFKWIMKFFLSLWRSPLVTYVKLGLTFISTVIWILNENEGVGRWIVTSVLCDMKRKRRIEGCSQVELCWDGNDGTLIQRSEFFPWILGVHWQSRNTGKRRYIGRFIQEFTGRWLWGSKQFVLGMIKRRVRRRQFVIHDEQRRRRLRRSWSSWHWNGLFHRHYTCSIW